MKLTTYLLILSQLVSGAAWAVPATHFNDVAIQNSLAVGQTGTANTKSVLELVSTTKAFLPPRMTTVQKNAIVAPAEGSVVWDSTLHSLWVYNATAWITAGAGGISYAADTGSADAYAIAPSPAATAYTAGDMYSFKITNANTGASTLAVSGMAAKNIKTPQVGTLPAGALAANAIALVVYDGTQFQLINAQDPTRISPLTTKGDLATFSTVNTKLAVGTDGQIVVADSNAATGLNYVNNGSLYRGGINLLSNNSWELSTSGWTSTGTGTGCTGSTAYARTTTAGQYSPPGVAGACFDSASTAETLTATSTTITSGDGISGRNGAGSCILKAASGNATHLLEVYDGTNVISSITVTSSTSQFARATVPNFTFPSSGTVTLRLKSVASNEPVVYLEDCYLGLSENFNQSQQNQAQFIGSAYIAATANCTPTRTNTVLGALADTDCPGPTVESNPGPGVIQTTDYDTIKFGVNSLPPGTYLVTMAVHPWNSSGTHTCSVAINDGTTTSGAKGFNCNSTTDVPMIVEGIFTYTSAGNRTFELYGAADTNAINISNSATGQNQNSWFHIYRFPNSADVGQRLDNYNWRVDANISGANFDLGTSNQSSYVSMTNASMTLTNNTSTTGNVLAAQIPCSSTNPPTGTTCGAGTEDNGVSFTLPAAGDVEACVELTHTYTLAASGSVDVAFEIVETPTNAQTISQEGKSRTETGFFTASHAGASSHRTCGTFSFTSAGQKVLRLMYEQAITATVSTNIVLADASASLGQRDIHWTVRPLTVMTPTPVFYGGAKGTYTNDSASAGYIGELLSANSAGVALAASNNFANVASMTLTAGDWDVEGTVRLITGTATGMTRVGCAVSLTSANNDVTNAGGMFFSSSVVATVGDVWMPTGRRRISVSSNTTVYLVGLLIYSASTGASWSTDSFLQARRVR